MTDETAELLGYPDLPLLRRSLHALISLAIEAQCLIPLFRSRTAKILLVNPNYVRILFRMSALLVHYH